MPTRADIEAAVPKCPARPAGEPTGCGRPLAWHHEDAVWACPDHGPRMTAEEASQRMRAAAGLMHFMGSA